jgi:hypothetical protein
MKLIRTWLGATAWSCALSVTGMSVATAQLNPPEVRGLRGAPFVSINPPPELGSYGEGP